MGMAASQARLLSITARLSDNELRSQTINNAKMRLATQSSQASENYLRALNDANLMFNNYDATGMAQSQLLTYNALTMYSAYNNQYGLVNSAGQLLVSEAEAAMFQASNGNLNAYLKAHGLEFNTTYFDQIGNYECAAYPDEFSFFTPNELQKLYEAYGSYESSLEVENYTKYYEAFVSNTSAVNNSMQEILPEFFKSRTNSTPLNESGNFPFSNNLRLDEILKLFKDNVQSSTSNTYSLTYLHNNGYISDDVFDEFSELLNSIKIIDGEVEYPSTTYSKDNDGLTIKEDSETGVKTYTFGGITLEEKNGTISFVEPADGKVKDDNGNILGTYESTGSGSIQNFINGLSYHSAEGNLVQLYHMDSDNTIQSVLKTSDSQKFCSILNGLLDTMLKSYEYVQGYFNDDKFCDDIMNNKGIIKTPNGSFNAYGVVLKSGEKVEDVFNNYINSRNDYLSFISSDYSILVDMLENGDITAKDLHDVDFVLRLIKELQDGQYPNMNITENFKTVVHEFIIDEMIRNFGEPKYAWIDENDYSNTGNADAKAQWLTNLFNRMTQGYKVLENGLASSSEWLEFALESGLVTIEQVDKSFKWKSIDYKTCSNIIEQTDNSAAVARAEAEYTRAMNDINAKDSMYDIQLKNIDTEHNALQQEYDVIKGVINKNIERTFKFSSNG